jgi:uncharacterized protein YhbP (UPF0306 family)
MPLIPVGDSGPPVSEFENAWLQLATRARLAHVASVTESGSAHINACYFAPFEGDSLVILTPPSTVHAKNLAQKPECAVAISLAPDRVGDEICGVQLVCEAHKVSDGATAGPYGAYTAKFPEFGSMAPSAEFIISNFESRFYLLEIRSGKLIDERTFGRERYIEFARQERS